MIDRIVILTEESRREFLKCIMPQLHGRLAEPQMLSIGIYVTRSDKSEEAAGALVCELDAGILTILSLGVLPHWQRHGLGSRLVEHLATICARQQYLELVAGSWSAEGETGSTESFFIRNGFESTHGDGVRYVVKISDIGGSALERHISQVQGSRMPKLMDLAEVPDLTCKRFVQSFALPDDVFYEADPQTSTMWVVDDKVTAAVLLSRPRDGVVEVIFLCSTTEDGRTTAVVLLTALGKLYRAVPAETVVLFTPENEVSTRMAERLLEGCKTEVLHERVLYRSLLPMWS